MYRSYRLVNVSDLKACLEEAKQEIASKVVHTDLLENQKKRLFAAVKAHFDVEKKTFADNLLKKTKDILIQGHKNWVQRDLLRSSKIMEAAVEDESIQQMRTDLVDRVKRLNECLSLLRDVPLPTTTSTDGKRKAAEMEESSETSSSS